MRNVNKSGRKPVREKSSLVGRLGFALIVQFDHESRDEPITNVHWYSTRSKALWAQKQLEDARDANPESRNVRCYVKPLLLELETAVEGTLAVVDLVTEWTQRDLERAAAIQRGEP